MHTLGNALTNVSLGAVAVSFTHTIKALEPMFSGTGGRCVTPARLPCPSLLSLGFTCRPPPRAQLPSRLLHPPPIHCPLPSPPAVLLSAMFLGDKPSLPVLLTLAPIIGGVVLASTSELSFNWKGFLSGAHCAVACSLQRMVVTEAEEGCAHRSSALTRADGSLPPRPPKTSPACLQPWAPT